MDPKSFGLNIAALRRKNGLTQAALAGKLNVSDKTVSKWETGLGFPEITQLPVLANVFGVTIDYLMTGERKGIAIAGNILTDIVKNIDCYPNIGMLSNITSISRAVGGCVPNTAIDLAKIDNTIPISAIGCMGNDDYGRYVIGQLQKYGIDTSRVNIRDDAPTSFSDVMNLESGERTFFHARGANALFSPDDVDIAALQCSILHIGYILLLDKFDEEDVEYGTVMARFLHDVRERGIKTSVDVVSDSSADYPKIIIPALKFCDYVIFNELECCNIWGEKPYDDNGNININVIKRAMQKTLDSGVKEKVIVHCKSAGFCLDKSGEFTVVPSLKIPSDVIRGSVGAGDAYCAGCLYGLYNGFADRDILEFASAAAACNLFSENAVDGMKNHKEIQKMEEKFGRMKL